MASSHTSTTIDETPLGLYITMPVPRVGCVSVFLVAWLIGWAAGEISAIRALLGMGSFFPGTAFLLFWLVGWTVGGVFAAGILMMTLGGHEILSIGSGVVRRRAEAFGRGLSWRYPLERCSNLRPTGGSDGPRTFISFDYSSAKGDKTIRVGSGLTESSAEEIAERVWSSYPSLMPAHERRRRERAASTAQTGATASEARTRPVSEDTPEPPRSEPPQAPSE
jgi:hypothetical protein